MEKERNFFSGMTGITIVLLMLLGSSCSNRKATSENCQQVSLDTWTNEFITRMNAGYLPDDANQLAELVSVKALAQCMDEQQKNN